MLSRAAPRTGGKNRRPMSLVPYMPTRSVTGFSITAARKRSVVDTSHADR